MRHGEAIGQAPVVIEGFGYQGEDVQSYNGKLYFLMYDFNNGVYYLYSYDYESPPVKVTQSTVYHYEFVGSTIYYTKDFVQGPIYAMNIDGSGEKQLTQMRAHSFSIDGGSIYFYATDAGTAPGLVRYNIASGEETTVVFPFFSHNYLVFEGYAYYVNDGTYRSIHRVNLSNQAVEDLWVEISDYTISLNISDGMLYILTGSGIYKSNLDGSGRSLVYEADESLQTGIYIFGDRIYVTDGYDIIVVDKNNGSSHSYPMN
jgi:Tol biopolymer transport system component